MSSQDTTTSTAQRDNGTRVNFSNGHAKVRHSSFAEAARSLLVPGSTESIPPHLAMAALRIALTAAVLGIVAGLALPGAWRLIKVLAASVAFGKQERTMPVDASMSSTSVPQLHFYLCAWATFHLLEFVITAGFNESRLYADSFLIQNGIGYHVAHLAGVAEFYLESKYFPQWKAVPSAAVWAGLAILILGQVVRSLAMIHAAGNFSHEVAMRRRADHELVTDGIYGLLRHPSYFGFFYWAVGTQVFLANPLSTAVFCLVLWRFFNERIRGEEIYLNIFFKENYAKYRARTYTLIPFIR